MKNSKLAGLYLLLINLFYLTACDKSEEVTTIISTTDCTPTSTFRINLDPGDCTVSLSIDGTFSMTTNASADTRTITSNSIPNHSVGQFPNSGNPNTIRAINQNYVMDLTPTLAGSKTYLTRNGMPAYTFGVLLNGIELDPIAAEWFEGTSGRNLNWNKTVFSTNVNLGEDCNNAHVQPSGKYHHHGTPSVFIEELGADGSQMVKMGYAGDGFPIYYKYVYDSDGSVRIAKSGYQLKTTERGGDGSSAPSGCPDGTYVQDYEYVSGIGDLDECNGMTGKTPESESEYFYVVTDTWPSSPMCFSGNPASDFSF